MSFDNRSYAKHSVAVYRNKRKLSAASTASDHSNSNNYTNNYLDNPDSIDSIALAAKLINSAISAKKEIVPARDVTPKYQQNNIVSSSMFWNGILAMARKVKY